MTTYQEPPLHSRRAARQEERADAPSSAPDQDDVARQQAAEPLNYSTTSRPPLPQYDGQNLRPRRTAESTGTTESVAPDGVPGFRARDFSPEGRRIASPSWAPPYGASAPAAEAAGDGGALGFQTLGREELPPMVAEGSAPVASMPITPTPTAPTTGAVSPATPIEHTMTRRELRALREAGVIADDEIVPLTQPVAPVAVARPVPPVLVEPVAAPQPTTRLDSAVAEFDALAAPRDPAAPSPVAPAPLPGRRAAQQPTDPEAGAPPAIDPLTNEAPSADGLSAFDALFQAPSTQALAPEASFPPPSPASQLQAPPAAPALVSPPPPAYPFPVNVATPDLSAPPASAPVDVTPRFVAPAPIAIEPAPIAIEPAPIAIESVAIEPVAIELTGIEPLVAVSAGPSLGHWSMQSELDDAEQVNETTISRSVGNGAITTSALVLPATPEHQISGPISTTGQVLLTGSILLPESLAVSGAHPSQLDESDIDHLLDPGDHQVASTDSTPVRAIRAVSTHTATGGIIAPTKPKGTRGFTVLIIAASGLAIVVVGLLVAGLMSGTL